MTTVSPIPSHTQVLVIGGGPAGSYAAAALARERIQVVLLEAAAFPRYHIGESLIPSVRHYLRFIDAEQTLVERGFKHKPGAAFKLDQSKREGYTDFVALGHSNSSWNVTRADFDKMLLDHAKESGACVYERTRVTSIRFSDDRPVSAEWSCSRSETGSTVHAAQGEISFDFVIDASGRAGLISDRHLKNRHYNESLRNIALWGYWTDVWTYGVGTGREGAPWFEALADNSGWTWFIPLHDGTTSIGIVVNQKRYRDRWKETPGPSTLCERYKALLALAPSLVQLIGTGTLIAKHTEGEAQRGADTVTIRSAADFSYSASRYGGEGFRIVGDAGAFIDPLFSSGVHLAMTSALSAVSSICASIRGDCSEAIAAAWHTRRFTLSYTRFQMVVLSAYEQIRSTRFDVLRDVDEDGYERAFACIRPVIQGASDMGTRLSERELQNALDFCSKFFEPTDPEQRARALRSGLPGHLFDVSLAPVDPKQIDVVLGPRNEDQKASDSKRKDTSTLAETEIQSVRMVMEQANARRVVHCEYLVNNLEVEEIDGYVVRLRQGSLGLSRLA